MNPTHNQADHDTETSAVLRAAADYIDRHGWIQGAYYAIDDQPQNPAASADGALAIAAYGEPVEAPGYNDAPGKDVYLTATVWLALRVYGTTGSISAWNDDRDTTGQDVVDALRDAADDLDYVNHITRSVVVANGYALVGGDLA